MFHLNQIIFINAINFSKNNQLIESEISKTAKKVIACAFESKCKCWVPGERNHNKMSKAVEEFLATTQKKNKGLRILS